MADTCVIENTVKTTIETYRMIESGETVLVALSGGADSVALLLALYNLRENLNFNIVAAHLNHGIRNEEADRDSAFSKALCDSLEIPFCMAKVDAVVYSKENGKTLEQGARELRYDFLKKTSEILGASKIATAHHARDRVETILLNIARGTGLSGLSGIGYKNGMIIRPMLDVKKEKILEYLTMKKQNFVTDSTNMELNGARNKLRLDIIPYFEKHINPAFIDSVLRMSELTTEDETYLLQTAREALYSAKTKRGYDREKLLKLSSSILTRALRIALSEVGANVDIERVHIDSIIKLMAMKTGACMDFPRVKVRNIYESITFEASVKPVIIDYLSKFNINGETKTPFGTFFSVFSRGFEYEKSRERAYMDADKLTGREVVRSRYPGDRYSPVGMMGSKKLKDFFIDKKVERRARECPIIALHGDVIYVPGFFVSNSVAVDENTERIIITSFKASEDTQ
ncbi:MAG: tRNA lysidine(34) synthetase TilS [Clostridia bacterium]